MQQQLKDKLEFLERLKTAVRNNYNLQDLPQWIVDKTYLRGRRYSFKDHEFQLQVVSDYSRVVNVQKCAQVGLSEVMSRYGLGLVNTLPNFNTIITFPFSGDASDFARTRIDPVVLESPELLAALNPNLDNSEMKQFNKSLLYFRGTNGSTQAISIPADAIISDEIDRSDPHILSQYTSRLNHSAWKLRRNFSTPTVSGYGIAGLMQTSRRFRNLCKCEHCNHWFNPSYFDHVRLPGFDDDLRTLTKHTIHLYNWQATALYCPRCGKVPSLQLQHREWVQENVRENYEAAGYYIQPFDAPNLVTCADLVVASTEYKRYTEFVNQSLGLVEADARESIIEKDIEDSLQHMSLDSADAIHGFGADMGIICSIVIGRTTPTGEFLIVHRERVTISDFQRRKAELCQQYRCLMKVCDSQPYVDTILQMQKTDSNLYGGVYVKSKSLELFKLKMYDGELDKGKLPIHTVSINRNQAFDELMGVIKRKQMIVQKQNDVEDETFKAQFLDMKRVQQQDEHDEQKWVWEKSADGNDHYHHATLYCYTACQLRRIATANVPLTSGGRRLVGRMKVSTMSNPNANAPRTLIRR